MIADEGTQAELLDLMQTRQELYDLLGYSDYEARDRAYFSGDPPELTVDRCTPAARPSRRTANRHDHNSKRMAMAEPIYSPGLEGVIAGETAISTIAGGLQYRGYSIEDLAEHATFEEVAYLLLHGELPKRGELAAFRERLAASASIPPAHGRVPGQDSRQACR